MTYDLFVILLSDRTHRTRRNVLASASPHYLVPGYSWWARKVRLPRSRCRAGAKNAKRKDRKCRCKKCIKKLHKMQLTRGTGVRDKKKGPFKMVEKFLRYLRRWLQTSFQGIKCKKFCRGKTEKCKKCNIQGGMPSRKKRKKKKPHSKKQNVPKCK